MFCVQTCSILCMHLALSMNITTSLVDSCILYSTVYFCCLVPYLFVFFVRSFLVQFLFLVRSQLKANISSASLRLWITSFAALLLKSQFIDSSKHLCIPFLLLLLFPRIMPDKRNIMPYIAPETEQNKTGKDKQKNKQKRNVALDGTCQIEKRNTLEYMATFNTDKWIYCCCN